MKPSSSLPSRSPRITGAFVGVRRQRFLHDFYALYLKSFLRDLAYAHGGSKEDRPSPGIMGKSAHMIYIGKLSYSPSVMATIMDTARADADAEAPEKKPPSSDALDIRLQDHIYQRISNMAKWVGEAEVRFGVRLLHLYTPIYDERFHACRDGRIPGCRMVKAGPKAVSPPATTSPPETWPVTEEEWSYAMTALWALKSAWNLPFFPDAYEDSDAHVESETSKEVREVITAHRCLMNGPQCQQAERTANPEDLQSVLSPYRLRTAAHLGLSADWGKPEGKIVDFKHTTIDLGDIYNPAINQLLAEPVFEIPKGKKGKKERKDAIRICECLFEHPHIPFAQHVTTAIDLLSATFFDPAHGMFAQKKQGRKRLLRFIFFHWLPNIAPKGFNLRQVTIYSRPITKTAPEPSDGASP